MKKDYLKKLAALSVAAAMVFSMAACGNTGTGNNAGNASESSSAAAENTSKKDNKKLTKRISKEGHLIGNHTYSHADLARTNYNKASVEINKTNEIITSITGTSPKYIRPPYGDVNKKLLENTGMRVVLWNVDPEDWKDQNADIVVNRIISHVRPGDIILLHDIFKSSVEAALKTVDILQDKGYQFVTVDKLNNSTIK